MAADLERTNVYLPTVYKDAVREAGENLSDFIRDAMRREFKRRKIRVEKLPEIKAGRPKSEG